MNKLCTCSKLLIESIVFHGRKEHNCKWESGRSDDGFIKCSNMKGTTEIGRLARLARGERRQYD